MTCVNQRQIRRLSRAGSDGRPPLEVAGSRHCADLVLTSDDTPSCAPVALLAASGPLTCGDARLRDSSADHRHPLYLPQRTRTGRTRTAPSWPLTCTNTLCAWAESNRRHPLQEFGRRDAARALTCGNARHECRDCGCFVTSTDHTLTTPARICADSATAGMPGAVCHRWLNCSAPTSVDSAVCSHVGEARIGGAADGSPGLVACSGRPRRPTRTAAGPVVGPAVSSTVRRRRRGIRAGCRPRPFPP